MTIKVFSDRIELGNKIIAATPTGIRIDDALAANTQQQGYVKQANFTARELAYGNFVFQGSVAGFTSGGYSGGQSNTIDKFPFPTNTNATDVGDLTQARWQPTGQSSSVNGYASGGNTPPGFSNHVNTIDKFPFANNGNATDVGDLSERRGGPTGQSSSINGYASGGRTPTPAYVSVIDKFPFATDTNASNISNLTVARTNGAGQSSKTHGYTSGGGAPVVNNIDKFPFAADTNATDVGDLTLGRYTQAGQSSTTNGYSSGGSPTTNTIDKFPFATDTNSTDVGDLTQSRYQLTGQSSTTHGYSSGGDTPVPSIVNTIDRFPFSADTNASDVGDLTQARSLVAGQQY